MRLSDFWWRMDAQFGAGYAESLAADHVMSRLGGRTVREAIESGEDPKDVWRAVCDEFQVPGRLR